MTRRWTGPEPHRRPARGLASILPLGLFLFLLILAGCAARGVPPGPGLTPEAARLVPGSDEVPGFLIADDGYRLPLRAWLPAEGSPRAVLLALHGFNDYSHAFAQPGAALAGRGIAVFAYDQRGFGATAHAGLWAGRQTLTGDLATATRLLRDRYPGTPLYLLGTSMGGAVVLAAEARAEPPPADGLILAAPAVWARDTQPWYQRAGLWLMVRLAPGLRPSGRGLEIQASDNIEMLRALGRDPLVLKDARFDTLGGLVDLMDAALSAAPKVTRPTLLLYGEKDEIIPQVPVELLWRKLPDATPARYVVYPDGWHMLLRDLQAAVVVDDIAAWIADPAGSLPSVGEARARETRAHETRAGAD